MESSLIHMISYGLYPCLSFCVFILLISFFKIRILQFLVTDQKKSTVGRSTLPIHWPIIGTVPSLLWNLNRIILFSTDFLLQSNGSIMLKGPWFSKMELFVTADLANVQHIMAKRYDDFQKGTNFHKIFDDIMGDGIFNVDGDLWTYQRKIAHAALTSLSFRKFSASTVRNKLHGCLIPILEHASKKNLVVDLQDLFTKFTSDITFTIMMGRDPGSLSMDLPVNPMSNYIHNIEEVLIWRHILPETVWRLQRWLGIGIEKTCKDSIKAIDQFLFDCIAQKQQQEVALEEDHDGDGDRDGMDLLSLYIMQNHGAADHGFKSSSKFLRDTLLTLVIAGQDTTSLALTWFFWLLSKYPNVEKKIKKEVEENISITPNNANNDHINEVLERGISKLVYLHGAICETLRLYPPLPLNHKAPLEPVVLPSGHKVNPWTKIILNCFVMGRMRSIWGEDCMEFKPERWITEQGTLKHEPSYKFFAFNAGPRICLGKDISIMQMKMVISIICLHKFHFQVVEGQTIEPKTSLVLGMKNGLLVRIVKYI